MSMQTKQYQESAERQIADAVESAASLDKPVVEAITSLSLAVLALSSAVDDLTRYGLGVEVHKR